MAERSGVDRVPALSRVVSVWAVGERCVARSHQCNWRAIGRCAHRSQVPRANVK